MEHRRGSKFATNAGLDPARRILQQLNGTTTSFHIVSLIRQVAACEVLLTENPLIDVAILGQFKAGKSSYVIGLINKSILLVKRKFVRNFKSSRRAAYKRSIIEDSQRHLWLSV